MSCDGCRRTGEFTDILVNTGPEYAESYRAGVKACLREALISECFGIRDYSLSGLSAEGLKTSEYLISGTLNVECYDNWNRPDGKAVLKSADMTIELHYNGKEGRELVKSWHVEKPERDYGDLLPESLPGEGTGYTNVRNKMCHNRRSLIKLERPIELTVLNDFEKRPWECEIEFDRKEVYSGEEIEIEVINIKDIEGNQSREFNRIIIQALEGKIVDGEGLEHDPDLKAFMVGDGTVTFNYQAPTDCDVTEDTIRVYRSCTISRDDQWPLSKTELDKDMTEKTFKVICDKYETEIGVKVQWEEDEEEYKENGRLDVNIAGTFELWHEYSQGGITQYYPEEMNAKYSYDYMWVLKDPPSCKDRNGLLLKRSESASGTVPITRSAAAPMAVHMKVQPMEKLMDENMPEGMGSLVDLMSQVSSMLPPGLADQIGDSMKKAGDFMSDRYEVMLTTGLSPKQFANVVKTICKGDAPVNEQSMTPVMDSFAIYLHSKIEDSKQITGSRSWKSDSKLGANIYINDLAESTGDDPLRPKPGDKVNYSVSWSLKRKTNQ